MYSFTVIRDQSAMPAGALIRNIFEDYWAPDYMERSVLLYGRLRTLWGEPLYETEDLENQYSYLVSTVTPEGKTVYLDVYSGSSGPAIGGLQDEESRKAADALVELILQAEPADHEYTGYYMDFDLEVHWTVRNGTVKMEQKQLELSDEERSALFQRVYGFGGENGNAG